MSGITPSQFKSRISDAFQRAAQDGKITRREAEGLARELNEAKKYTGPAAELEFEDAFLDVWTDHASKLESKASEKLVDQVLEPALARRAQRFALMDGKFIDNLASVEVDRGVFTPAVRELISAEADVAKKIGSAIDEVGGQFRKHMSPEAQALFESFKPNDRVPSRSALSQYQGWKRDPSKSTAELIAMIRPALGPSSPGGDMATRVEMEAILRAAGNPREADRAFITALQNELMDYRDYAGVSRGIMDEAAARMVDDYIWAYHVLSKPEASDPGFMPYW